MQINCYLTFPNTYQAIKAEKVLKEKPWAFKMVPVPRRISSSCGTALGCGKQNAEEIKHWLAENGVVTEGYFEIESEEKIAFNLFSRKRKI